MVEYPFVKDSWYFLWLFWESLDIFGSTFMTSKSCYQLVPSQDVINSVLPQAVIQQFTPHNTNDSGECHLEDFNETSICSPGKPFQNPTSSNQPKSAKPQMNTNHSALLREDICISSDCRLAGVGGKTCVALPNLLGTHHMVESFSLVGAILELCANLLHTTLSLCWRKVQKFMPRTSLTFFCEEGNSMHSGI